MNDLEVWEPVKGFEGFYEVSSFGQVRREKSKRLLKQFANNKGYLRVSLSKSGESKCYLVHRLVADAFIPNPENLSQLNHKDENKTNNCVSNLEWCTAEYNVNYGTAQERHQETCAEKRETLLSWAKDPKDIQDINRAQRLARNARNYYWRHKI